MYKELIYNEYQKWRFTKRSKSSGWFICFYLLVLPVFLNLLACSGSRKLSRDFPVVNEKLDIFVKHYEQKVFRAWHPGNSSFQLSVLDEPEDDPENIFDVIISALQYDADQDGRHNGLRIMNNPSYVRALEHANLDRITSFLLKDVFKADSSFRIVDSTNQSRRMEILPYGLVLIKGGYYELQYTIEAAYYNGIGKLTWKSYYTYYVPDNIPLMGQGSLLENDAQRLKVISRLALLKCIEALVFDMKGLDKIYNLNENVPHEFSKTFSNDKLLRDEFDTWVIEKHSISKVRFLKIISKNPERLEPHRINK